MTRRSDALTAMDLCWKCVCGCENYKPREEFKPPYFVCEKCQVAVYFTEKERDARFNEQVKRMRAAILRMAKR
jgi:hypothetical protein